MARRRATHRKASRRGTIARYMGELGGAKAVRRRGARSTRRRLAPLRRLVRRRLGG